MTLALLFLGAYLLGGIPFGVLVCRAYGIDLFKVGSGNIGATNVKRALGNKAAYGVFLLDMMKGLVPALVGRVLIHEPIGVFAPQTLWFLAGVAAIVGHSASPFLRFKGGKGVSTAMGAVVGAAPIVAVACFSLFLVLLFTTHYMSLASILAVSSSVGFGFLPGETRQLVIVYLLLSSFVVYRHKPNIVRLANGTEPKFYLGSRKQAGKESDREPTASQE